MKRIIISILGGCALAGVQAFECSDAVRARGLEAPRGEAHVQQSLDRHDGGAGGPEAASRGAVVRNDVRRKRRTSGKEYRQ